MVASSFVPDYLAWFRGRYYPSSNGINSYLVEEADFDAQSVEVELFQCMTLRYTFKSLNSYSFTKCKD
jgi:hypothetical protein